MTQVIFIVALFTSVVGVQVSPAESGPRNISEQFSKAALRATQAIRQDTVSSNLSQPTPTADQIDKAASIARTPSDKAFVNVLREFYLSRKGHNLQREINRTKAETNVKAHGQYSSQDEFNKAVEQRIAQDRNLAKKVGQDNQCADALIAVLRSRVFKGVPRECRSDSQ